MEDNDKKPKLPSYQRRAPRPADFYNVLKPIRPEIRIAIEKEQEEAACLRQQGGRAAPDAGHETRRAAQGVVKAALVIRAARDDVGAAALGDMCRDAEPLPKEPLAQPKPKELKTFRVTVRFSDGERQIVDRRAARAMVTPAEYTRRAALGLSAAPPDPDWRRLLSAAEKELTRQNRHLEDIAKHLDAKTASPATGDTMVGIIARSVLFTHRAVRQALDDDSYVP